MTININLLPKKEKGKKTYSILLVVILLIVVAAGGFGYYYINQMNQDIKFITQENEINRQLNELYRQNLSDVELSSEYEQLLQSIHWVQDEGISHVYLIEQLTKLLPTRGYWLNYSDDGESTISLRLQFDTQVEAAYYLNRVLEVPWVTDAIISDVRLVTQEIGEIEVERYLTNMTIIYDQSKVDESNVEESTAEEEVIDNE